MISADVSEKLHVAIRFYTHSDNSLPMSKCPFLSALRQEGGGGTLWPALG